MSIYADLELNHYYLILEQEGEEISLVSPVMETNNCYLLMNHDEYETTYWKKKGASIFEIVDELTEEQVEEYENLVYEEDDEEEEWEG